MQSSFPKNYTEANETLVLMGSEAHSNQLNFFGGKREQQDVDCEHTAAREFHEESNSLANLFQIYATLRLSPKRMVFWHKFGKYALHLVEFHDEKVLEWPTLFKNAPTTSESDMEYICWVNLNEILDCESPKMKQRFSPLVVSTINFRKFKDYLINNL